MANLTLEATVAGDAGGTAALTKINPLQVDLLPAEPAVAASYSGGAPHAAIGTALRHNEQIVVAEQFLTLETRSRTYGEGNYGDGNYGVERYYVDLGTAVVNPAPAQPAVYTHHGLADPLGTAVHITGCTTFTPPSNSMYGASTGHSDATGTLSVLMGLSGSSDGTSTATGTLGLLLDLAGTSTGTSTGQGTLGRAVDLGTATSTGTATTTGTLSVHHPTPQPLAGTSTGHSAASGSLSITLALPPSRPFVAATTARTAVHSTPGIRFHQQRRRRVT